MAVDKNKIIAEATKLVQKGALDKAIAAYQKITAEDPKDVRVLLKIGELYQKKSEDKLAAEAFQRVAETYAEQGFFLKAVAVYKQIVKLDPDDVRVNERLAGLYQQLGLMSDAMSQLQYVATAYEKAGDGARLTDVLKRMVELDPENIASSIKLGELYGRSSQPGPALECFRRAAAYLKKHSRADEFLKVAERITALEPDDHALTSELAHIYLAKGDTKRALAKLQNLFKVDPKNVATLQLLAQAFRDLGQTAKTISVYKELAHVHQESGRVGDARATWRKVQELAPDDDDAAAALGTARAAPTPPPVAAAPAPRAPPPGPPPGARGGAPAAPPPRAPAGSADAIPKLLTETDVYVKYGLHDKAFEHLRKILAIDPQCADALERRRDLHVSARRPADAAEAGAEVVRALLSRGEVDRARDALFRLRDIDPSHPAIPELGAAAGGTEEVELEPADVEDAAGVQEVVLDVSGDAIDDDALALAAAGAGGDEIVDDEPAPEPPEDGVALEVGDELEPDLAAAGDALAEAAAVASADADEIVEEPVPPPPARPPAARVAPAAPPPAPRAPAAPARRAAVVAPPPPPPPPAADDEADLADELEEADFFLQQGLLDDARDALTNLLTFYPGNRGVEAKLAEVERRAAAARPPRAAAPAPRQSPSRAAAAGADEGFDIARELEEELGAAPATPAIEDEFQYSVEDVFNQFKKGVEQTVKQEDTATHYDLGIAYKEMGLLDDAVSEFEVALRGNDRKKEVDCLSMIGLCQMQKGAAREAIRAYQRALGSEVLSKDAAKAVHFELGSAYEAAGDREAALFHLQKVNKLDPAFREVAARVKALGGGPGRPPADAGGRSPAPTIAPPPRPPAGPKKNIGYL
jgi:tetratricopeptide (TPR) repeat protein